MLIDSSPHLLPCPSSSSSSCSWWSRVIMRVSLLRTHIWWRTRMFVRAWYPQMSLARQLYGSVPWTKIALATILIITIAAWQYESLHPCLTPSSNKQAIYYMLHAYDTLLTQHGVPHWIDFGSMIGAYRYNDMIPWDYDGDVSFDVSYQHLMHFGGNISQQAKQQYNIELNAAVMSYQGYTIDIFRWRREMRDGIPVYVKSHHRLSDMYEHYYCDFNASLVEPTVTHHIGPVSIQGSNDLGALIRLRYPHTYQTVMPYKTVCYLPWVIPQWWGIQRTHT